MQIDAINNPRVSKLTGCINIEGHGIEILRDSLVLVCIESHQSLYESHKPKQTTTQ